VLKRVSLRGGREGGGGQSGQHKHDPSTHLNPFRRWQPARPL
jgi:hypothetical protein